MKQIFFFIIVFFFGCNAFSSGEIDSLYALLKNKKLNDKDRVQILKELSFQYYYINPDSGIAVARRIFPIAKKNKNAAFRAKANVVLATNYYVLQKYDSAKFYYRKAIEYGERKSDLTILSSGYNNLGLVYMDLSDFKNALKFIQKGLEVRQKLGDKNDICASYDNIGLVYQQVSDYPTALKYQFKALSLAEKLKDERLISDCLNNIAVSYASNEDHNKALEYYFRSVKYLKDTSDHYQFAYSFINISNTFNMLNKSLAAFRYSKIALKHAGYFKDIYQLSTTYNNLGLIFYNSNDSLLYELKIDRKKAIDSALFYFFKSLSVSGDNFNYRSRTNVYINLSTLFASKNDFTNALKYASEGYLWSLKAGARDLQIKLLFDLAILNQKAGNFSKAYETLLTYTTLRDEIFSSEKNNEIISGELKYEFNKRHLADSLERVSERNLSREKILQQQEIISEKEFRMFLLYTGLGLVIIFSYFLYNRMRLINRQKKTIEEQKGIVEEKQKEITDSINYAKRIQYTLLAHEQLLKANLGEYFVLFRPKDIVSGDFYWATKKQIILPGESNIENNITDVFYLAVCDCTGHGVPGAFMSLLNISFLNEAINEKNIDEPNDVLNFVRERLIQNMEGGKDGMDAILVRFKVQGSTINIDYAAAHNRPILISGKELTELTADKMPVGNGEQNISFTKMFLPYNNGDMLYLITDGYADQFGGAKGKKFKYSNLNRLLTEIQALPAHRQHEILNSRFDEWKGELEQVDDVCIIGIKL